MRILLASDIHGNPNAAELVNRKAREENVDLFVACGDITNFGPLAYAEQFLRSIEVETLAVPGNCDPPQILRVLEDAGVNMHGRKRMIDGRTFVGIGGSNPTPFNTPFELSEDEIFRTLDPLMERAAVLISHPPPFGYVDIVPSGGHAGSKAVRDILEKHGPSLVMCGHIHEGRGIVRSGTVIVNPGPARYGNLAVIEVGDGVEVKLL